jgi:hypothetical protein
MNRTTKTNSRHPRVAFVAPATWINEQLEQATWRTRESVARRIVNGLAPEELRALPPDTRYRLREQLSQGRVTDADRRAVDKLLAAEQIEVEYQPGLTIKGSAEFVAKTREHLGNLKRLSIGRSLLLSLRRSGRRVVIIHTDRVSEAPPDDFKSALAKGAVLQWRDQFGKERKIKGVGTGSDTTVKYNPELTCSHVAEAWRKHPPEIGLAHELIHADDAAYGRLDPEEVAGLRNYERQAVGLGPYINKKFTENKFRAAWSTPLAVRTYY